MKSDIIKVTNAGAGIDEALNAALACAAYRGLEKKDALHLRLLAEEMLGMMRQITGETEADFWVQSEGLNHELHLVAHPIVTGKVRKELLKVSTSGKNAAAVGVMGKLRDIFSRALVSDELDDLPADYATGFILPENIGFADPMAYAITANMVTWSMQKYKSSIEDHSAEKKEEWDELEKSIVANLADEVKIAITGDKVEMTVYKNFTK